MPPSVFDRPVAHRGFHDRAMGIIENSRSAFEEAISRGYAIECDLQLSADNVPVVFHDGDLKRLLGRDGHVNTSTADALGSWALLESETQDCPQSFSAFLDQIAGRTPLIIELKKQETRAIGKQLAEAAFTATRNYAGQYVFKSFDPYILACLHRAGYRGPLGIVTYSYDRPEWHPDLSPVQKFVLRNLLHWPASRYTFISCEQGALTRPVIRFLRHLGMKVMSWTIRDKDAAGVALRHADQIVFEGFEPDS